MTANIPFNPSVTTNAAGSFMITNAGYVQGTALDDPAIRNTLAGGILASTETIPMWGGVGICENIPTIPELTATPRSNLGGLVGRATLISATGAAGALTGFSVFDQNYSAINTPQSPVPLAASGMQVNFYRLGTGMRIAVACTPSLVSLDGSPVTQQVSWDFTNQRLVPYSAAYAALTVTGLTWAATSGGQYTFTYTGTNVSTILSAGSVIDVSGVVSTFALSPNGPFTVAATPTSSQIVVSAPASANAGSYTSGGAVAGAGGQLAIQGVLQVEPTNCMTVTYNSITGFANWNRNDCCAIIRL
jgi:hypothetical protein